MNTPLFDLFWENSKLNEKNFMSFVNNFINDNQETERAIYPTADLQLKLPKDRLFKTMCERFSERKYSDYKLTVKQLSSLFSCFAEINNRRLLPSGGGKYPIEVYAFVFNAEGIANNKIVYYNPDLNALSFIGECPEWSEIKEKTGLLIEGKPSALFVFTGFPGRITSKYGERGGRFLLMEAGHYLQNLSLRVAYEGLGGVEAGGLHDDCIKEMLGLNGTDAVITLGYVCGGCGL
jgi:SagB-type dehydrogenase family enzyme